MEKVRGMLRNVSRMESKLKKRIYLSIMFPFVVLTVAPMMAIYVIMDAFSTYKRIWNGEVLDEKMTSL